MKKNPRESSQYEGMSVTLTSADAMAMKGIAISTESAHLICGSMPVSFKTRYLSVKDVYVRPKDRAVTVEFGDGTKATAISSEGAALPFSAEAGFAMAVAKKALGGYTEVEKALANAKSYPKPKASLASIYSWILSLSKKACWELIERWATVTFPQYDTSIEFGFASVPKASLEKAGEHLTMRIRWGGGARGERMMTFDYLESLVAILNEGHADPCDPESTDCDLTQADVIVDHQR